MTEKKKLSTSYKLLRALGFHYSEEEYGQVSLWGIIRQAIGNTHRKHLQKMMDWSIIEPIAPRKLRAVILRRIGCNVGKNVYIGDFVRVDLHYASYITIEDDVHISAGCRLLCHKRNISTYKLDVDYSNLPFKKAPIHICKNVALGQETFVMPGVTIGEGSVIGARSLVSKDIPSHCVAVGSPAKVIRQIEKREEDA